MFKEYLDLASANGLTPQMLLLFGLGLGIFVMVFGLAGAFNGPSPEARRMRAGTGQALVGKSPGIDLIRSYERRPEGFLRAFVPSSRQERTKLAKLLRRAGLHSPHAVRDYYLVRSFLAFLLPAIFLMVMLLQSKVGLPSALNDLFESLAGIALFQIVAALVFAGFYGTSIWLRIRIRRRKQEIEFGLPNALDLLQVAVEAGLGFDSAIARVANELAVATPAISEELTMLQLEIQAGKDRDRAFIDMAERTGVDEVASFANVVLQATQFGTSVSDALATYANEMRLNREIRAQAKANRLPVQMSAVMAAMCMPTLLMLCMAPVMIRWIRVMSDGG